MTISNEKIDLKKLQKAEQIINDLQTELKNYIAKGSGPFLAAIYDENNNLIAKKANSVINETCSHNHAEMNTIKEAEKVLNTYDLSSYNLKLYVTAEPCIMFKPNWLEEFAKRGITVYGEIAVESGEKVLQEYVSAGHTVYKPER